MDDCVVVPRSYIKEEIKKISEQQRKMDAGGRTFVDGRLAGMKEVLREIEKNKDWRWTQ